MRPSDQVVARLAHVFAVDARPWEELLDDAAAMIGESAGDMCLIGAGLAGSSVFSPVGVFHNDPRRLARINETHGFVWSVSERASLVLTSGEAFVAAESPGDSGQADPQLAMPWREALLEPEVLPHMMLPVRFGGSSVGMVVVARRLSSAHYTRADATSLDGPVDVLALALRRLCDGPASGGGAVTLTDAARSEVAALSDRERHVVALLAQGLSSAEIATTMYLSRRTVEWYRARILQKLDHPTRAQLVALGRSFRD